MKYIAHRGNIRGPNVPEENTPHYLEYAIKQGFDVEVDVRVDEATGTCHLGHDGPALTIDWSWLEKYRSNLWIHCKDLNSLTAFQQSDLNFNYFWHQNDDYTLTSHQIVWVYPGRSFNFKSVVVVPEWELGNTPEGLRRAGKYECYGICSDYVDYIK